MFSSKIHCITLSIETDICLSIYLPVHLNRRGGHQTGSGKGIICEETVSAESRQTVSGRAI